MIHNCVYIISSTTPDGVFYKIGITNNIDKRFMSIKTGNQYPVKVEYVENIDESVDLNKIENWIHSAFKKNRKEGEWFINLTILDIRKKIYKYLLK